MAREPELMIMNKYFSILSVDQNMLTLLFLSSRSSTSTEEGTGAADTVTRKSF